MTSKVKQTEEMGDSEAPELHNLFWSSLSHKEMVEVLNIIVLGLDYLEENV